jgi:hypothetical protein
MLLMGFTLPVINTKVCKISANLMTNKNGLTTITDEFDRGTMLNDVIFQCVDKLFICLNPIYISDLAE